MTEQPIRFDDGEAYERGMGVWSRIVGERFLDWLSPAPGQRWVDVGAGNGAFTELLMARCTPSAIEAIDPSEGQLAFARARPGTAGANFRPGDATSLPFGDGSFDAAVMALVIFFVPDPAKGVAEMARVTRSGGVVAAYAWDIPGGGLPIEPIRQALRRRGIVSPLPPRAEVSALAPLRALWTDAGMSAVETVEIRVARTYQDFDEYWATSMAIGGLRETVAAMTEADIDHVKADVRADLPPDPGGRTVVTACANAIRGVTP